MTKSKQTPKAKAYGRVCMKCDNFYLTTGKYSKICPKCRKFKKDYGVVKSNAKKS